MTQFLIIIKRLFSVLVVTALAVSYTPFFVNDGVTYAAESGRPAIVQLEAGYYTSAALLEDGSLWMWGCNEHGEAGVSANRGDVTSPVHVMDNVKDIEIYETYTRALTTEGTLWEWGRGKKGSSDSTHEPRKVAEKVYLFSGNLVLFDSGKLAEITVRGSGSGFTYTFTNEFLKLDTWALMDTYAETDHAVTTTLGELQTWGTHRRGQLGLLPSFKWSDYAAAEQSGDPETSGLGVFVEEPSTVVHRLEQTGTELSTPVFTKAVIGNTHSAYLAENGDLYYSGVYYTSAGSWYEHVFSTPQYAASGMKDLYMGSDRLLVKDGSDNIICYGGFDLNKNGSEADLFATMARVTDQVDTIFKDCDLFAISDSVPGYMIATKKDGSLWVCGANSHGQLGLGDVNDHGEWTSGDAVLDKIYGNESADPVDPEDPDGPGDTPDTPGDEGDVQPGKITESGETSPGQTWGVKMVWGRDNFSFSNNKVPFAQHLDENDPYLFSSLADIFNGTNGNVSKCHRFYKEIVGEEKLKELYPGFSTGYIPEFDMYECLLDKWGSGFNEVDRRMMLHDISTEPWSGSCYGMSTMAIMNFRKALDLKYYNKPSNKDYTLYNLDVPFKKLGGPFPDQYKNMPLKDAIGYYQSISSSSTFLTRVDPYEKASQHEHLHNIIYELKNHVRQDNTPILLCYSLVKNDSYLKNDDPKDDSKSRFAHAVVAYALETEGGPYIHDGVEYKYRIRILDPNYHYTAKTKLSEANQYCLYVTADERQCYLPIMNATSTDDNLTKNGDLKIYYYTEYNVPILKSMPEDQLHYDIIDFSKKTGKVNGKVISAATSAAKGLVETTFIPTGADPPVKYLYERDSFPEVEITQPNDTVGYQNGNSVVYVSADKGSTMQFEYQGVALNNSGGKFSIDLTVNNGINHLNEEHNVVISGEGECSIEVQAAEESLIINGDDLEGVHVEVGDEVITLADPDDPDQTVVELVLWGDGIGAIEYYYDLRTVDGRYSKLVYTGKTLHPELTPIGMGGFELQEGKDYEVIWPESSVKIGEYYATLRFIGKYSELPDEEVEYYIVPGKARISKLTSRRKSVTVKYGKVKGAGGYQIAIRKKGTSKWKKYKVAGSRKLSKTIKSLRKGKIYQVRVRAYKVASIKNAKGRTVKNTFYGSWSKTKKIKVK